MLTESELLYTMDSCMMSTNKLNNQLIIDYYIIAYLLVTPPTIL